VDNPKVSVLTFKQAEEGQGYILRLWNTSSQDEQVAVTFPGRKLAQACLASIIEEDQNPLEIGKEAEIPLSIPAGELCSLRVVFTPLDADERGRRG
jgi:alpha-mannosidase